MIQPTVIDLHYLGEENAIAAFLLETSEGPILIESGPHSTIAFLEKGLASKGYQASDIKHVFLTHIHLDHAGAAWYFAERGAKVYVHPFGFRHLVAPDKLMASAKMIYKEKMDMLWGQMNPIAEEQLVAVEDLQSFQIGDLTLQAHYTPGHAVHHIAWQIEDTLFAGDVAGVKIDGGPVVPPCPPPDIQVEDWMSSIARIKGMDLKRIYLTHFGAIEDLHPHLTQLGEVIEDWANWIKPHFEQKADPAVVTPMFQKYVLEQLKMAGVSESNLKKYDSANPAWMSVAGLMRYWKIKARKEAESQ